MSNQEPSHVFIQFCFDKELELLIPYEYRAGIISTGRMKKLANNLLELAEILTDEEISQINERDKAEEIAILERQNQEFLRQPKGRKPKTGVVYLIQAKGTSRYKIGCTTNLKVRLNSLRTKNPYELEVIHSISSNDIEALEKAAHAKFSQYRTHSEWFELPDGAVDEFRSYEEEDNG